MTHCVVQWHLGDYCKLMFASLVFSYWSHITSNKFAIFFSYVWMLLSALLPIFILVLAVVSICFKLFTQSHGLSVHIRDAVPKPALCTDGQLLPGVLVPVWFLHRVWHRRPEPLWCYFWENSHHVHGMHIERRKSFLLDLRYNMLQIFFFLSTVVKFKALW